jgi:hypothetical protein
MASIGLPGHSLSVLIPHHDEAPAAFDENDVTALMIVPKRIKFELTSDWADRHDRIDQKFYYLTPDAVANWEGVISAGAYSLYEECREALSVRPESC